MSPTSASPSKPAPRRRPARLCELVQLPSPARSPGRERKEAAARPPLSALRRRSLSQKVGAESCLLFTYARGRCRRLCTLPLASPAPQRSRNPGRRSCTGAAFDPPARQPLARGSGGAAAPARHTPKHEALRTRSTRRDSRRGTSTGAVRAANRADLQNTWF
eukprot:COSAG06_NODE_1159_length_10463_cov_10.703975_7_plen_162_part_00